MPCSCFGWFTHQHHEKDKTKGTAYVRHLFEHEVAYSLKSLKLANLTLGPAAVQRSMVCFLLMRRQVRKSLGAIGASPADATLFESKYLRVMAGARNGCASLSYIV